MDENSPLDSPDGAWWNRKINRRETIWLGLSGAWALSLFGWMLGWTRTGEQNQIGPTYQVSPEAYQAKVSEYKDGAGTLDVDGAQLLVPPDDDVYVGALQWAWDGLPALLQPGKTYRFHLGSYDVQHGLSIRREDNLSQQISLQVLPGYEWVIEMSFDDTGTYHVICNEFCGTGHRSMHGRFVVREHDPSDVQQPSDGRSEGESEAYGGWFTGDAKGGATENYNGSTADETGSDEATVTVGADGNGGTFAFDPPAVAVSPGTTVTFEWASNNHNVLVESQPDGANWQGHEGLENEDFSVSDTFDTEGVYTYYCQPHLSVGMKGVVEVQ
jgi:halocyanin-like protein